MRRPPNAAFEVRNAADTESGAFGQSFLGQPCKEPVAAQQS
jgi:hypothetical protein